MLPQVVARWALTGTLSPAGMHALRAYLMPLTGHERGRPRETKGTSRPGDAPVAVYPGSGGAPVRTVPNTRVDRC